MPTPFEPAVPDRDHGARDYLVLAEAPLRLGVMCTIGPLRFTPFLARFRIEFPGLRMSLVEGTPARLGALLEAGELDLAVLAQSEPFPPHWDAHALYRERFVVAMPPAHPLSAQRAVALRDLHGERYVSRASCEYAGFIDALLAAEGVVLDVVFESEREEWVQMMIMAGAGVACMPEYSPLLPGLVARPMIEPPVLRAVALVARAGRRPPPAAATFAAAIKRYDWSL
jgi:LysR family hydrogen peroxide-inducible transcriptional activator